MRQKRAKGEIVEVEGGRLVRSLGRKDRHSKVCTAKGRRVRLSANTAIRFYDVQDRLGYDRPSKAIDWLMKEAKCAIEALNYDHGLPATVSNTSNVAVTHALHHTTKELEEYKCGIRAHPETPENRMHNEKCYGEVLKDGNFGVFNDYPESLNLRNRSQAQDLALSLQSFQENQLLLQDSLFSALTPLEFEGTDMVQFEKMFTWDPNVGSDDGKESVQGFATNSLPRHLEPFSGQNQIFSQREPLQSSFLPSIHAASIPSTNSYGGTAFASDEFLGFSFYPQIQGQEEEEDNLVSKQLSHETSLMYYQDF